ncbi:hypothetical protein K502DRAFT_341705 [Neoconidiobolus thromboides FSU 785]|nr:hypothetical protein K502DRAFT_341705 [Neoconidiobolus thromboides FSU 785]
MYKFLLVSIVLFHNICGQETPGVPPEYTNFVSYRSLYSTEKGKCIITDNTNPKRGLLVNKPYLGSCNDYKANFTRIQLPANTFPMCSLDPNWVYATLPGYNSVSSFFYPIDQQILDIELPKCINKLKTLDKKNAVSTMYGLDAKSAFCKRHLEFELKVFGNTTEIKNTKKKILDILNIDFPKRPTNGLMSDLVITASCVGTNLQGCVDMWEKLLEKKDNCLLNTLGYKVNPNNIPTTWLYADGLDVHLAHIWARITGLGIEKSTYKGIDRFHISHNPQAVNQNESFSTIGLIG